MPPRTRRLPADERRAQVLAAAVAAFAEGGYAGTTTHDVATLAGVSQPYVVRMFDGKQALFLEVYRHVIDRIEDAFRDAARERAPDTPVLQAAGRAYRQLTADRDLLRVMQHGFVAAADPGLGPTVRAAMAGVYALIRELSGASPEEACDFLARGMLVSTLVVLGFPEHTADHPQATDLVRTALP